MRSRDDECCVVGDAGEDSEWHQRIPSQTLLAVNEESNHDRAEDKKANNLRAIPRKHASTEIETDENEQRDGDDGYGTEPVHSLDPLADLSAWVVHV